MLTAFMWVVSAACVLGAIANACKKRWGFAVWVVGDICLVAYNIHTGSYPEAVLWGVYTFIAAYGFWKWGKLEEKG